MLRFGNIVLILTCLATALGQQGSGASPQLPLSLPLKMRVASGVMARMLHYSVEPRYPEYAARAAVQGDVILRILIDSTGEVVQTVTVEGDALLAASCAEALRDFQYRPFLLNGAPVMVETQLGFRFTLPGALEDRRVEPIAELKPRWEFQTDFRKEKTLLFLFPHQISGDEPQLPADFKGNSGSVYLALSVGADGKVGEVKVLGGDEPFLSLVIAAVKQFVYQPELIDGQPSAITTMVSYHFKP